MTVPEIYKQISDWSWQCLEPALSGNLKDIQKCHLTYTLRRAMPNPKPYTGQELLDYVRPMWTNPTKEFIRFNEIIQDLNYFPLAHFVSTLHRNSGVIESSLEQGGINFLQKLLTQQPQRYIYDNDKDKLLETIAERRAVQLESYSTCYEIMQHLRKDGYLPLIMAKDIPENGGKHRIPNIPLGIAALLGHWVGDHLKPTIKHLCPELTRYTEIKHIQPGSWIFSGDMSDATGALNFNTARQVAKDVISQAIDIPNKDQFYEILDWIIGPHILFAPPTKEDRKKVNLDPQVLHFLKEVTFHKEIITDIFVTNWEIIPERVVYEGRVTSKWITKREWKVVTTSFPDVPQTIEDYKYTLGSKYELKEQGGKLYYHEEIKVREYHYDEKYKSTIEPRHKIIKFYYFMVNDRAENQFCHKHSLPHLHDMLNGCVEEDPDIDQKTKEIILHGSPIKRAYKHALKYTRLAFFPENKYSPPISWVPVMKGKTTTYELIPDLNWRQSTTYGLYRDYTRIYKEAVKQPHLITEKGVHMCYKISMPILILCNYCIHRRVYKIESINLNIDLMGDDNISIHDSKESCERLQEMQEEIFNINKEKTKHSQYAGIITEQIYVRSKPNEPLQKVPFVPIKKYFPTTPGFQWIELGKELKRDAKFLEPDIFMRLQMHIWDLYGHKYKKLWNAGIDIFNLPGAPFPFPSCGFQESQTMMRTEKEIRAIFQPDSYYPSINADEKELIKFLPPEYQHEMAKDIVQRLDVSLDGYWSFETEKGLAMRYIPLVQQVPAIEARPYHPPEKLTSQAVIDKFNEIKTIGHGWLPTGKEEKKKPMFSPLRSILRGSTSICQIQKRTPHKNPLYVDGSNIHPYTTTSQEVLLALAENLNHYCQRNQFTTDKIIIIFQNRGNIMDIYIDLFKIPIEIWMSREDEDIIIQKLGEKGWVNFLTGDEKLMSRPPLRHKVHLRPDKELYLFPNHIPTTESVYKRLSRQERKRAQVLPFTKPGTAPVTQFVPRRRVLQRFARGPIAGSPGFNTQATRGRKWVAASK
jgi:hypothetical protein